jgi:hypothetical protein
MSQRGDNALSDRYADEGALTFRERTLNSVRDRVAGVAVQGRRSVRHRYL